MPGTHVPPHCATAEEPRKRRTKFQKVRGADEWILLLRADKNARRKTVTSGAFSTGLPGYIRSSYYYYFIIIMEYIITDTYGVWTPPWSRTKERRRMIKTQQQGSGRRLTPFVQSRYHQLDS